MVAAAQLHRLIHAPTAVWLPDADGLRVAASVGDMPDDEVERVTVQWVALHGRPAGAGTSTLAGASGRYIPLGTAEAAHGVIGFQPPGPHAAAEQPAQRHLLETVVTMVRELIERIALESKADAARLAVETERVRSTLLSSVSHDLRTPLATITGAATTLLDVRARLDEETRRELLARVSSEAQRLERLLDNVLRMTRLDGGTIAPSLDWELPDDIVSAAIGRMSALAQGREIRSLMPPRPALALLDAVLVEQLVVNYLENALAHAKGDTPIEVSVLAHSDNNDVIIEVADRGPGLPEGPSAPLFDKFVRGTTSSGAGLGLAICQAIAHVHGGRVWAHPRPGGGAVFGAAFPRGGPHGDEVPTYDDVLDQTENA